MPPSASHQAIQKEIEHVMGKSPLAGAVAAWLLLDWSNGTTDACNLERVMEHAQDLLNDAECVLEKVTDLYNEALNR
jgi:hypothetical protein